MRLLNRISHTAYSAISLLICAMLLYVPAHAAATLSSIDVTPVNPLITVGDSQAFAATGTFSNGSTQQLLNSPVTALEAADAHSCAVQCWGLNASGQLGNGTIISSATPVTVSGISTATALAAGSGFCNR